MMPSDGIGALVLITVILVGSFLSTLTLGFYVGAVSRRETGYVLRVTPVSLILLCALSLGGPVFFLVSLGTDGHSSKTRIAPHIQAQRALPAVDAVGVRLDPELGPATKEPHPREDRADAALTHERVLLAAKRLELAKDVRLTAEIVIHAHKGPVLDAALALRAALSQRGAKVICRAWQQAQDHTPERLIEVFTYDATDQDEHTIKGLLADFQILATATSAAGDHGPNNLDSRAKIEPGVQ